MHCNCKMRESSFNSLQELFFFGTDYLRDIGWIALQFWKRVTHLPHQNRHKLVEERLFQIEILETKSQGPSNYAAQDCIPFLVAWPSTVSDSERCHAQVVSNYTECNVIHVRDKAAIVPTA